jgi:DNA mismatch repair protein MutS
VRSNEAATERPELASADAPSGPPDRRGSVSFGSILFDELEVGTHPAGQEPPEFFTDLNLDQVVAAITAGRDEYDLRPFFYTPLRRVEAIRYRHDVMRDLENPALFQVIEAFARGMRAMRSQLAQADKLHYDQQRQSWFLDAVDVYCDVVGRLTTDLSGAGLRSRGFLALREHLESYTAPGGAFAALQSETRQLEADLSGIRYRLHIKGSRITVSRPGSEPDYGADVVRTFEKFSQGVSKEYRFEFRSGPEMDHVEAAVLDLVARLYADVFSSLADYCRRHRDFVDRTIGAFDREVQFYAACLEHVERLERAGLPFCYPTVTERSKKVHGREVFDLALADELVRASTPVVTNDFHLEDPERILVVSGPNQGGKTTFARTFGQLHHLASIGCPVPGKEARLFLADRLFTHFDREEGLQSSTGKLEDDLRRIHSILEKATSDSILIMNESLSSTTPRDALFLGTQVLREIVARDMLCVCVTFLDELASLSETTVSMVAAVHPDDPALRTFRIVRKPADGLAYAMAIAEKYRLTYESVRRRIAP